MNRHFVPCDRCGSDRYTDDGSHTVYCQRCGSAFYGETLADAYRLWETAPSKRTCVMERLEGSRQWECSACGELHEHGYDCEYCPWCGAKVTDWRKWAVKSGEDGLADLAWDRYKEWLAGAV